MRVASDIASAAGEVINSGVGSDDYEGNNFMWVRVQVNITKPLTGGRKIGLSNGEESWVSFEHERLPNLCYWWGRITHHDKDCLVWQKRKGALNEGDQQFRSWLLASTLNIVKKMLVRVAGYEKEVIKETEMNSSGGGGMMVWSGLG